MWFINLVRKSARCRTPRDNASGWLLAYAVAVKKQLSISHDEFHVFILCFFERGALLQSYDLDDILQAYHRVGLKFRVTADVTFNKKLKRY